MSNYVYRAVLENYSKEEGIKCKEKDSDKSLSYHVNFGSKKNVKTKFISTSKKIGIAAYKYAIGKANENRNKRAKIVLIDLDKLPKGQKYYDLTNDSVLKEQKINRMSKNYCKSDAEVTIEGDIGPECIKEIPPMLVDILFALESSGNANKMFYDILLDRVVNDDMDIDKIIERCKLNKLEHRFIELYYKDMNNMKKTGEQILSEILNDDKEYNIEFIANSIRTQIIKNVVSSQLHRDLKYYTGPLEGKLQSHYRTEKDRLKKDCHYFNDYLSIKVNNEDMIKLPGGVEYRINNKNEVDLLQVLEAHLIKENYENPSIARESDNGYKLFNGIRIELEKKIEKNNKEISLDEIKSTLKIGNAKERKEVDNYIRKQMQRQRQEHERGE